MATTQTLWWYAKMAMKCQKLEICLIWHAKHWILTLSKIILLFLYFVMDNTCWMKVSRLFQLEFLTLEPMVVREFWIWKFGLYSLHQRREWRGDLVRSWFPLLQHTHSTVKLICSLFKIPPKCMIQNIIDQSEKCVWENHINSESQERAKSPRHSRRWWRLYIRSPVN